VAGRAKLAFAQLELGISRSMNHFDDVAVLGKPPAQHFRRLKTVSQVQRSRRVFRTPQIQRKAIDHLQGTYFRAIG
jgi:hypothetical protein